MEEQHVEGTGLRHGTRLWDSVLCPVSWLGFCVDRLEFGRVGVSRSSVIFL
jgi:hypothetical protein